MKIADSTLIVFLLSIGLINSSTAEAQRRYKDYDRDHYHRYNYPVRVQRVVYDYHPRYVIPYRGYPYYYDAGYFYRPYGTSVQIVAPPLGIRVSVLPRGYRPMYIGGQNFYYFNGTFYRRAEQDRDYEVVRAPLGVELPDIPDDARVVVVDDQKYFEYNGTYYKERIRQNGEIWYEVVGKNGKLQTDHDTKEVIVGSTVNTLPSGCKVIILNNKKYYVSQDDVYYEEEIENNELRYKVVGTPQSTATSPL